MTYRALAVALGGLALLSLPAVVSAQTAAIARSEMTGAAPMAAPAQASVDQIRADIWAANAERKADYARRAAEHKAAMAAYEAEVARVAAETARINSEAEASRAAYAAEVAAYEAKLKACRETMMRGCRYPSPPPRRIS